MYPRADFGGIPVLAGFSNIQGCDQVPADEVCSRGWITEGDVAAAAVAPPPPSCNAPSGFCPWSNFSWSLDLGTNLQLWELYYHALVPVIICAAL